MGGAGRADRGDCTVRVQKRSLTPAQRRFLLEARAHERFWVDRRSVGVAEWNRIVTLCQLGMIRAGTRDAGLWVRLTGRGREAIAHG